MTDVRGVVAAIWKGESARIVAALMRLVHDVGRAEELAQDALVAALEQWPRSGVPDNPGAWLMTTAKRRAVDGIRRERRRDERYADLAREVVAAEPEPAPDDVLRLMFISCHPVLPTAHRVALTLRVIGGLSAAEIGRAFLTGEQTITRRIAAAKQALTDAAVPFELPAGDELARRLASVLEVIYLIFNEGYSATAGEDLLRPELTLEALRLARLLARLAPDEAEVHGLVALLEIQQSRSAARTGPDGEPVQLHEQNRGQWDQLLIRRGFAAMLRAREIGGPAGPYVLQAAIAVSHAQARTAEQTDWTQIATLYGHLERLLPTPVVRLNRAVAVGMARGPQAGLDLTDDLLADPSLRDYHLLPGVRGDLLRRLGRTGEARLEFERAAALATNAAERRFLRRRAEELPPPVAPVATLGGTIAGFLARDDLLAATLRSYGKTLDRLRRGLGERAPLMGVTANQVARVFATTWGDTTSSTWNRHLAAVRTFGAWAGVDLAAGLTRRTEPAGRAATVDAVRLDAVRLDTLVGRADLPVRERTLWLMLHESGASVTAVLSLDVDDLDLDDRRARARAGGGRVEWRARTASLLPALIGGRTRGPLFLAARRPGPARTPADADLCPHTGRRRLSYERAEYLFKKASGGHTLRQLRQIDATRPHVTADVPPVTVAGRGARSIRRSP